MPHTKFLALVEAVGPLLTKQETHMRTSIAPNERLALTIRYLATGKTFQSLSFQFRIGKSTVSQIIMEVCDAIYQGGKDSGKVLIIIIIYYFYNYCFTFV